MLLGIDCFHNQVTTVIQQFINTYISTLIQLTVAWQIVSWGTSMHSVVIEYQSFYHVSMIWRLRVLITLVNHSSFRSKLVSFLRRLSPRLSRPSKNPPQPFPTICPWVQVEYSAKPVDKNKREESQESDTSFQQEARINELRKNIAGSSAPNCASKVIPLISNFEWDLTYFLLTLFN